MAGRVAARVAERQFPRRLTALNSFAGAVLAGAFIATCAVHISLLPLAESRMLVLSKLSLVWNYELLASTLLAVPIFLFVARQFDWRALAAFGLATAGATAGWLEIRVGEQNAFVPTLTGWITAVTAVQLLSLTLLGSGPAKRLLEFALRPR